MSNDLQNKIIFQQVVALLQNAREQVLRTVNSTMVCTYFEIGRIIVEDEQSGAERAGYAKQTLLNLSVKLNEQFGKGYSVDNLESMRLFYLEYGNSETPSRNSEIPFGLSWSHYVQLLKIKDVAFPAAIARETKKDGDTPKSIARNPKQPLAAKRPAINSRRCKTICW